MNNCATDQPPAIYWFRRDLRTTDLPALRAATAGDRPLIACYILDDATPGDWAPGAASRWWLHHSLQALQSELDTLGCRLLLRRGETVVQLRALAKESGATSVFCSRAYAPWESALEARLHDELSADGVALQRFAGTLLFEPETVRTQAGQPFKVFTPFWNACRKQPEPTPKDSQPLHIHSHPQTLAGLELDALQLLPTKPDWAGHWPSLWTPGSAGAHDALRQFLNNAVTDYDESRNHPARKATSRLSPHLHFGEISPATVWREIRQHTAQHPELEKQQATFLSELGWREFSQHLLFHFPTFSDKPFREGFSNFPWLGSQALLQAWQAGQTGYPLVDAGMRELWHTGFMHNRVRMITASFLTKHLLIPWQTGARWFWDTLVDADLANNSCGWQWVAGSGADAAPYFRIFNPTLQSKKFDAAGAYIRTWVPELATLPDRYLHEPTSAPQTVLDDAGITLGATYPLPVVDHASAREAALLAYASIR